jgi:tetratricopeptide (TPR) repeat protein
MAEGALSIKLRCASWQQLATIYKRDLSHNTMFLRAATPPAVGTAVRVDLTLPSATVIALHGTVSSHVQDPQRGSGVEIALSPIPASSIWLIESALASENKRLATPIRGVPIIAAHQITGMIPTISENAELSAAEQDLIKALVSEAESLKKLNPFLVLGVGYEAGDAEVRAAFGELTKRYHPDRFARYESAELRALAAEIFILIRDAYRKLGDAPARAQLLQSLGKPAPAPRAVPGPPRRTSSVPPPRATQRVPALPAVPPPAPAPAGGTVTVPPAGAPVAPVPPTMTVPVPSVIRPPAPPSRGALRRPTGEPPSPPRAAPGSNPPATSPTSPDRRPVPVHMATTQPAPVMLDPGDLTALEDLIDQTRLDEALAGYRMLAKRHPGDRNVRAGAELVEGLLALNARDRLEAAQRFETALEIDPSNERAARELAEMRRQATNERKGLLSRLMGKKEP